MRNPTNDYRPRNIITHNFSKFLIETNDDGRHTNSVFRFPNGWEVSVAQGRGNYTNSRWQFEVAIIRNGQISRNNPTGRDIFPWANAKETTEIIEMVMSWDAI